MNRVFTTHNGFVNSVPVAPAVMAAKICNAVVSASVVPTTPPLDQLRKSRPMAVDSRPPFEIYLPNRSFTISYIVK